MVRAYRWFALGGALALAPSWVPALTLDEAIRSAMANDGEYQAARYEQAATREEAAISRAGLLPQLRFQAASSRIDGYREAISNSALRQELDYRSLNHEFQLRQTLFNLPRWWQMKRGQAQASGAEVLFDARAQDFQFGVIERYFDTLLAAQMVPLLRSKVAAFEGQRQAAARMKELGYGTLPEVDEATAARDLANAELLQAYDKLEITLVRLSEMTGQRPDLLQIPSDSFVPQAPQPASLAAWLMRAGTDSPLRKLRQQQVEVAALDAKAARAEYWPKVDLVLSRQESESDSTSTINQRNRYGSYGLELSLPLLSGGETQARLRQRLALQGQAEQNLRSAESTVKAEVAEAYQGALSGVEQIRAHQQSVTSAERALLSAKKGFIAGASTSVDVLDAERRLFTARRDLMAGRLDQLRARLALARAVGALTPAAIAEIGAALDQGLPLSGLLRPAPAIVHTNTPSGMSG